MKHLIHDSAYIFNRLLNFKNDLYSISVYEDETNFLLVHSEIANIFANFDRLLMSYLPMTVVTKDQ